MNRVKHLVLQKYLIETSIQIEKVKNGGSYIRDSIGCDTNCYSSYFVLYEFKLGLIKSFIDIYCLIQIEQNVSKAYVLWSEKFGARELKNFIILQAVISNKCNSIASSDVPMALRQIEAVIRRSMADFYVSVNKYLVGDFGGNEIVKFPIKKESDFFGFLEACKNNRTIPLSQFWTKHITELIQITSNGILYGEKYKKLYDSLEKIKLNVENSNKYNINRAIGDAVISVDTTKKYTLSSLDYSYEILCKLQQKPYCIVQKKRI